MITSDENEKFCNALDTIHYAFPDNDPESTTEPVSAEAVATALLLIWKHLGGKMPYFADRCIGK